jgi:hypothetical protein
MAGEELMAAFMGDDRLQGEVVTSRVASKRLCIHHELVLLNGGPDAVLRAARATMCVAISDRADEAQAPRNRFGTVAASIVLGGGYWLRRLFFHDKRAVYAKSGASASEPWRRL